MLPVIGQAFSYAHRFAWAASIVTTITLPLVIQCCHVAPLPITPGPNKSTAFISSN